MQINKVFAAVVCHEFGHILAFLLAGGRAADVDTIEFVNDLATVDGHTKINPCISLTDDQKIFVLFGGIAAENICGYSAAFVHRGTDANKLNAIATKDRQKTAKNAVLDALRPYKETLERLTARAIADYTRDGCPGYYRVFHDSVTEYLTAADVPRCQKDTNYTPQKASS